jgi:hypothetical protein
MLGARMGTYMTMLDNWDYKLVHDFDELKKVSFKESVDRDRTENNLC